MGYLKKPQIQKGARMEVKRVDLAIRKIILVNGDNS